MNGSEFVCQPHLLRLGHTYPRGRPAPREPAGVPGELARGARRYLRARAPLLAAASCSSTALPELPGARGSRNSSRRWGCRCGMGATVLLWVFLAMVTPGVLGELEGKHGGRDASGAGMASVPRCTAQSKARRWGLCRMHDYLPLALGNPGDLLVLNVLTCASPGCNHQELRAAPQRGHCMIYRWCARSVLSGISAPGCHQVLLALASTGRPALLTDGHITKTYPSAAESPQRAPLGAGVSASSELIPAQ